MGETIAEARKNKTRSSLIDRIRDLEQKTNFGFAVYFDNQYDDTTQLVIAQGETEILDINGATFIKDHIPKNVSELFDTTNSKILPVKKGDGLLAAISFEAKSTVSDGLFRLAIDIGGSFGEIFPQKGRFDSGADVYEPFYFPIVGYQETTFLANGGIPKVTSITGQTSIKNISIQIHRTSVGK